MKGAPTDCFSSGENKKNKKTHKQPARQRWEKRSLALSTQHSWSLARPCHRRRTSEVTSVGGSSHLKSAFHFFLFPDICCLSATPASCSSFRTLAGRFRHRRRPLLAASRPTLQLNQPTGTINRPTCKSSAPPIRSGAHRWCVVKQR